MPATSLRDMRFLIHDVFDFAAHYAALDSSQEVNRELIDSILDEAARFTDGELEPLNRSGDIEGCRWDAGVVTTPDGFKQAYEQYVAGGWASLCGSVQYGGQGLPESLSLFLEELMCSANMAWTMYPSLSRGVINALESHGSEEQKQRFLTKLLTGEWTGTMCLTEAHAGSDVGLVRTKAEPLADAAYAITGTKIFISAGDHDLAENIVHLVLARLPDSPEGTKGISMFVVPKINLDGSANTVACGSIEEKMGIHGNATCVLHFDAANGYLVGAANEGMRYMFTMMNAARLVVGLQAICLSQAALQRSLEYANERLQMRSLTGPKMPDEPADPIMVHPDVRRLLLTQRAIAEGGRALVYFTGQIADRLTAGIEQDDSAQETEAMLEFLTPIVKGALTELGFESVNHAVQVFGGHGYVRETGVEEYVRDARITMIYEGTTQIQGLDLLGRKILLEQGAGMLVFLKQVNALIVALKGSSGQGSDDLIGFASQLEVITKQWGDIALDCAGRAQKNAEEVGAAGVDFLLYSGYVALAFCWGRIALVAQQRLSASSAAADAGETDEKYLAGKLATARFFFARLLPRTAAHKAAIEAGAASLMEVSAEELSSI